ncbi:MAG TPA: hypothetical protein VFC46_06100, partial [Humisphaera sp.]|nr:hypothetical protein [Humisphaera sp.]
MTALSSATFAATPTATPDWRSLVSVSDAAKLLDLNPGHLARTCGEKLVAQGMAFFTKKPHSLGNPQWFVHRSYDPRLTPGPIGDDYQEPDLGVYSERQRSEALQRRKCVEYLRDALCNWKGSVKQILARVEADMREQFPELNISRSTLYAWKKLY